ncbi:MAG: tRNA (adenosine(37)-N6)-threonylcarbamoyltransferase complex dimerization subunit type 1 TsaB [Patescibacteria group bacterium]
MILLINTTEDKSQIALIKNSKILAQAIFEAELSHSEKLLPEISKLFKLESLQKLVAAGFSLRRQGFSLRDLEAIIVITGPGSYTGCRVGVATANALAFSLDIPIIGINKFEIYKNPRLCQDFGGQAKEKDFFGKKTILKIIQIACKKLKKKKIEKITLPFYEKPPHITKPKSIF